ncbi:hypothetical protein EXT46_10295 [Pseudoalteromonas sp. CO325X]|uniref:winged helix-turn-helix domain-containing protein n=1 Tax=Pseudoalteromonas sp. CO325X TaxID=1777262 RepID=UPI001023CB69|nr:winged helix-turn-helix domain-containing protein [Pseudoalteromonas sp. CO325X]RZF80956.1 hypothetical protein EXT46_10295 [Pseudoalteromonas sp. CO325X]
MQYRVGPWTLLEQRGVLLSGDIERELDPLLIKLITFFLQRPQQIVTREQLIEHVWQQGYVDNNAINRAISELRKKLKHPDDPAIFIKTHYRQGYSLVREVATLDNAASAATPQTAAPEPLAHTQVNTHEGKQPITPTRSKPSYAWWKYVAAVVFIAVLASAAYTLNGSEFFASSQTTAVIAEQKPMSRHKVTWKVGSEYVPLINDSGRLLAYSNEKDASGKEGAFVLDVITRDEVAITYKDAEVAALSWQHNSDTLVIRARNATDSSCQYLAIDFNNFPELGEPEPLMECDHRFDYSGQLSNDGRYFYFIRGELYSHYIGLFRYDVYSGTTSQLIAPMADKVGPGSLSLSPDGKHIAYLQLDLDFQVEVYVYSLDTGEIKRMNSPPASFYRNSALDWYNNETLLYGDEKGRLLFIDIHSAEIAEAYALPDDIKMSDISYYDNSVYYSPLSRITYQVVALESFTEAAQYQQLYASDSSEYGLVAHSTGHYFISLRSGRPQVWHARDGQVKQISFLDHPDHALLDNLRVSPSGENIVLTEQKKPFLLDVETAKATAISELTHIPIMDWAWHESGQSLYVLSKSSSPRTLYQFDFITRELNKVRETDALQLVTGANGEVFLFKDKTLISLTDNAQYSVPCELSMSSHVPIHVRDGYAYSMDYTYNVYRWALTGERCEQVQLPFEILSAVPDADGRIIITRKMSEDSSINRLMWE